MEDKGDVYFECQHMLESRCVNATFELRIGTRWMIIYFNLFFNWFLSCSFFPVAANSFTSMGCCVSFFSVSRVKIFKIFCGILNWRSFSIVFWTVGYLQHMYSCWWLFFVRRDQGSIELEVPMAQAVQVLNRSSICLLFIVRYFQIGFCYFICRL